MWNQRSQPGSSSATCFRSTLNSSITLTMNADRHRNILLNETCIATLPSSSLKSSAKQPTDFILRNPYTWFPKAAKGAELPDFRQVPAPLESSFQISTQKWERPGNNSEIPALASGLFFSLWIIGKMDILGWWRINAGLHHHSRAKYLKQEKHFLMFQYISIFN